MYANMTTTINSLEDLKIAINHPYRNGEFLCDGTQVFEVSDDDDEMVALIDSYGPGELSYSVNWESQDLYTEDGIQIESVY